MKAFMVAGLAFGDEGKGRVVDALVRQHKARVVVKYTGGCQCAHNVVTDDGVHHTFAQFGSGALAGAWTYLAPRFMVEPVSLMREADALHDKVDWDPLSRMLVHADCPVTTAYHRAANVLREGARVVGVMERAEGEVHGTTARGIGETRWDADRGLGLTVRDLQRPNLAELLETLRRRKLAEVMDLDVIGSAVREAWDTLNEGAFQVQERATMLRDIVSELRVVEQAHFESDDVIVMEGAQGVLLDQAAGFFPHVTRSDTTFRWADEVLDASRVHGLVVEVHRIGVTRAYTTRHGAGPLPSEHPAVQIREAHNPDTGAAGRFRTGHLDMQLLRYANRVCRFMGAPMTAVAVTHLDRVGDMTGIVTSNHVDLRVPADLVQAERQTRALVDYAIPSRMRVRRDTLVERVEATLGVPVVMECWGPSASTTVHR